MQAIWSCKRNAFLGGKQSLVASAKRSWSASGPLQPLLGGKQPTQATDTKGKMPKKSSRGHQLKMNSFDPRKKRAICCPQKNKDKCRRDANTSSLKKGTKEQGRILRDADASSLKQSTGINAREIQTLQGVSCQIRYKKTIAFCF